MGDARRILNLLERAYRRALKVTQEHLELHPDDARALYLGASSLVQIGDMEGGLKWAGRAMAMDPDNPSVLYNVACVYALVGDTDKAIDCLEDSITTGMGQKEWIEHDSDLDSLRESPRFQELVAKLD